jgi:hypothetical protein
VSAIGSEQLLRAWEVGVGHGPARRALALLEALDPSSGGRDPAALTIGERDQALLAVRERLFGPALVGVTECAECGEQLELALAAAALRAEPSPDPVRELAVVVEDVELRVRPLIAGDLLAADELPSVEEARVALLERCLLQALRRGLPVTAAELPESAVLAAAEALAEADPGANPMVALRCPACGAEAEEPLDVGAFLWQELEAAAARIVREVDSLARAYGWSEPDVLALSPRRRAMYLELAEA